MKPVDMTIFHSETTKGNCLAACIASILEIDIATMPNFAEYRNWELELNNWLRDNHGLCFLELAITENLTYLVKEWGMHYMTTGPSPRGSFWHACVGHKAKIVHDPHPDKTGLKEAKTYCFLVKL